MDAEVALHWKVMCRHLQAEAQVSISLFFSLLCTTVIELSFIPLPWGDSAACKYHCSQFFKLKIHLQTKFAHVNISMPMVKPESLRLIDMHAISIPNLVVLKIPP